MNVRRSIFPPRNKALFNNTTLLSELSDKIENQADENTENDAQSQGKVKCEVFPFDEDVTGKLSGKMIFLETEQHEADYD
jgi:hypothetical protein